MQQLKFSIIFIGLGAILGWFTHSAFNAIQADYFSHTISSMTDKPEANNEKKLVNTPALTLNSEVEENKTHFIKLLKKRQFDKAMLWYKEIENDHDRYLLPLFLKEVVSLTEQKNQKVFELLDVFLQEYYSSSIILVSKANALVSFDKIQQAFDAYLLAKNYAKNDQEYNNINQLIHDLAVKIFERFKLEKAWKKSIKIFTFLVEYEPQFAFYHLALAESYLKVGENDSAILYLQSITEDATYGNQATEMLEMLLLAGNSNHINLEVAGEHYIVDTLLADVYNVKLMIDTGASYSSLSSHTIAQLVNDKLAEKIGQKEVYTAGGQVLVDIYKLKKMSLGGFSVSDIVVAELDLDSSLDGNITLDGLLGVNFLNQFDFSVDQQNKQLILSPKN